MPGRFFLDSNIILYCFDKAAPKKMAMAQALVKRLIAEEECIVTTQVIQECLAVLTSPKIPHSMTRNDIRIYFETVLKPLCDPLPLLPLYQDALAIHERWKLRFYDALIVAGALALDCETLYSEDLQHGQRIESLTVINPFIA